jgi:CubicO group peptidase (beta-lactamase class C family)
MKRYFLNRFLLVLLSVISFSFGSCSMPTVDDISEMSSVEMIEYTAKGVKKAAITVGIIQNGQMSYKVYGENGREISQREHVYEIGSITKTFTTSLLSKAISENRVSLDNSIDLFLNLPSKDYYPSIKRIITHTSGYKSSYYEGYVSINFLNSGNSFYGITEKTLFNRIGTINLENKDYPFEYSNFNMAVVGLILESIYNEDYTPLMNRYIKNDLGLTHTKISDGSGDLSNYWLWDNGNPYNAAGAIISTITDMMQYAKMQMDKTPSYLNFSHDVLAQVNATTSEYAKLGIRIDAVGAGWMIDTVNNIIWHNGGTSNYNIYIGFNKTKNIAVVVLSNMAPDFRLNATVIGLKLLKELEE